MYSIADNAQFLQVQALWQHGFPADTPEDIAAFWNMAHAIGGQCLLYSENGQAVSMAFLLPAVGRESGREWPLWYVYAAVTHPDHRGCGLFGRLLDEAAARAAQNDVAGLFLRPAEPSLFAYYGKQGFTEVLSANEIAWQANDLYALDRSDDLQDAGETYIERRSAWLTTADVPHVQWPDELLRYAVKMAEESGGGAVYGTFGTALCECDGDRLLVRECLCAPNDQKRLATALARRFTCREILLNAPSFNGENVAAFGLLRPCLTNFPSRSLYMGLALE